jgi:hypothetical protein
MAHTDSRQKPLHLSSQTASTSKTTTASHGFLHEFIAGQIGGVAGILTVYPLDTAKIRLQTSSSHKNAFAVMKSMVKNDGASSLYRGLTSPVLGFGLTFAVSFSAYGYGCRQLASSRGVGRDQLTLWDQTLAGIFTGFVQTPFRQVFERVKSVMQVHEAPGGKRPYSWSGACAAALVREHGLINGLFQGTGSVLLREVPQFGIYYTAYQASKSYYSQYTTSPTVASFFAGGTAGLVQWLPPFYCFDVIKSRMQTCRPGLYTGVWDCARVLYKDHGMSVFFRGLSPALLRAFPLHAIIFVGYEGSMSFLTAL